MPIRASQSGMVSVTSMTNPKEKSKIKMQGAQLLYEGRDAPRVPCLAARRKMRRASTIGRPCTFFAKKNGFQMAFEFVTRCLDTNKNSFACHRDLLFDCCVFFAKSTPRRGAPCVARSAYGAGKSARICAARAPQSALNQGQISSRARLEYVG